MMGATELFFIVISHNVSFIGKTWWVLMLVFRLLVLVLAGFTLFGDDQETFKCNTVQPGCSNACFDVFAPVSVLRLWLFHLALLCLPHLIFATYVVHKVLSCPCFEGSRRDGSLGSSGSPGELCLHKALLHNLPLEWGVPRFYGAYSLVIILRILLETVFTAAQFYLFGLSISKSFLCYEVPCTSGVECYISRPTEKNLMLNSMLCVASFSVLLSLVDLVSSVKAMARWRRKREMLMEEISKGEQSSTFTATAETEDVLLTRRPSSRDEKPADGAMPNGGLPHAKVNAGTALKSSGSANDRRPEDADGRAATARPPTSSSASPRFVPHRHLKPPQSPKSDEGSPSSPRAAAPFLHSHRRSAAAGQRSGDQRAWV